MDSTPEMLSVGYRCMHFGYLFMWPKGENPWFILTNGLFCPLTTKEDVPYLYPSDQDKKPRESVSTRCFAC
ncbi:MAG: hypothetical protein ACKPKO_20620, partial [Candidatus Fonsibacter sp.]